MLIKAFKWISILLVLLIVAAIALVTLVDVNRFKPEIESFVKDNYDRTLTINGDLSLKLFPRVALALPASSLTDPKSDEKAFSLESARVSVAVLPLISGRVEAEKVQLHGLRASLIRFADGTTSIDDLIGAPSGEPAATEKPVEESSGSVVPADFRIGGIELLDAAVSIRDEAAKNSIELTGLNLKTGELRDNLMTPVALSVNASASNPAATAKLTLDARVQFELASSRYTVEVADVSVVGSLDGMPFDQKIKVSSLRGGENSLTADMVELTSLIDQPGSKLLAVIKTPLEFDPGRGLLKMRAINGQVDLNDAAVSAEPLQIPLSGNADINLNAETVAAKFKISAPEAALDATVNVRGFNKPRIKFELAADMINLDRYMPPGSEQDKSDAAAATDPAVDLSALKDLAVDGKINIGKLMAQGLTVSNVKAAVKVAGGEATLAPISMNLYGGSMTGRATIKSKNNRFTLASDLTGVNIGPLIKDLTKDELIEGNGEVRLRLQTAGKTVGAMKKALGGDARVALRNGAIMGINLGQKIRDAKGLLQAGAVKSESSAQGVKTDFAALTASFKIANGIATNTDLSGKSPLIRLGGGGKIDIAAGSLDYTARASVVGTSKGQGGKSAAELRGVTIPVRLTGPFEALNWEIDWAAAAKSALKSRVAEKLTGKLDPKKEELKAKADEKKAELQSQKDNKVKELKDKAASKIGDKLKGLLGN